METRILEISEDNIDEAAIREAAGIIRKGGLVAFPTETVYGLGGNAFDPESARKIYAAKGRPSDNPLIVHIADPADMYKIAAEVPEKAEKLAGELWPGPLTMILKKLPVIPPETTGGLDTVAVRLPSNRIARELIRESGVFIAAPSANRSGRPSTTKASHVAEDMDGRIEMILDGGSSAIGLESTIVDLTEDPPVILRPGYYNKKRIEEVIGPVKVDKGLISDAPPKAPGMKYRHYAPKAELTIVEGPGARELISRLAAEKAAQGARTAVICSEENKDSYDCGYVFPLGSAEEEEETARRLFDVLRRTDDLKVDFIYSEAFDTPKLGAAIMNRLIKAAGHRIIDTSDSGT